MSRGKSSFSEEFTVEKRSALNVKEIILAITKIPNSQQHKFRKEKKIFEIKV